LRFLTSGDLDRGGLTQLFELSITWLLLPVPISFLLKCEVAETHMVPGSVPQPVKSTHGLVKLTKVKKSGLQRSVSSGMSFGPDTAGRSNQTLLQVPKEEDKSGAQTFT